MMPASPPDETPPRDTPPHDTPPDHYRLLLARHPGAPQAGWQAEARSTAQTWHFESMAALIAWLAALDRSARPPGQAPPGLR